MDWRGWTVEDEMQRERRALAEQVSLARSAINGDAYRKSHSEMQPIPKFGRPVELSRLWSIITVLAAKSLRLRLVLKGR